MQRPMSQMFAALLAAPLLLAASAASAAPNADACGNIALAAGGKCEFKVEGGCVTQCQPITVVAACDGKCGGTVDVSCSASCTGGCEAECTAKPATFNCQGSCEADCSASCDGSCSAKSDKASCSAYCKASCTNNCDVKCTATPPSAACKARCQARCDGSCSAKAEFECSYACSVDYTGGCKTDCTKPDGALFCDGQYVHVNNIDDCIAYLKSTLNFQVDYNASGHCDASGCVGEADASIGCSAAPGRSAPVDVGAISAIVVGLGFAASRRRRRD
jgi:hypothetical protein